MDSGFVIVVSVLFLWFLISIIEIVNLNNFNLKYFKYGITISTKKIEIKNSFWNHLDGLYEEKEGQYVFIPDMKVGYFVSKFRFYRYYNVIASSAVFPLFWLYGTFEEYENTLIIKYKTSFRNILFISIIALFILSIGILELFQGQFIGFGISFGVLLVFAGVLHIAYIFKSGKMLLISDDISKILRVKK